MQAVATLPNQPSSTGPLDASAAQTEDRGSLNTVDFQNFLQLLTAQLRNQDPLSPIDSTDFVAQLASFSSVEQLVGANQRLDAIAAAIVGDGIEQYAGWIGRVAEAEASPGYFDGDQLPFRINQDIDATRVEAVVTNAAGVEISRFAIANDEAVQRWDGIVNGAPVESGAYTITAIYERDGQIIRSEIANTFATVKEVRLIDDSAKLRLESGVEVDPSQVVGLRAQS